jgi:uncharacterized protein
LPYITILPKEENNMNTTTIKCKSHTITDVLLAESFIARLAGYMFRKKPHHRAIMFNPCNSIHTFFMRFDIDVLFLNTNMEIVKKVERLKPGKSVMPVKGAKYVIESEPGAFKYFEVGDRINMNS